MNTQHPWLEKLYILCESNNNEEAIDMLFDNIDDLLTYGKMNECDELLKAIKIDRLNITLLVGLLSITKGAAKYLSYKSTLDDIVETRLCELTDSSEVESLLKGLVSKYQW